MNTFARIPDRLGEQLRLGEITFDQFGLMVVLVELADYRTRTVTFASIEALRHQVGWARRGQERDEKTVRNALQRLRELGEIDYQSRQGQRQGWKIRIVPDDYFGSRRASQSEVTSERSRSLGQQDAHDSRVLSGLSPRRVPNPHSPDTDTDGDEEGEVETNQSRHDEVAALIDESLATADVDRLLALVAAEDVEPNTRRVLADLLVALPQHRVDSAVASFRAARERGEVRNTAKYLVGILKGMTNRR